MPAPLRRPVHDVGQQIAHRAAEDVERGTPTATPVALQSARAQTQVRRHLLRGLVVSVLVHLPPLLPCRVDLVGRRAVLYRGPHRLELRRARVVPYPGTHPVDGAERRGPSPLQPAHESGVSQRLFAQKWALMPVTFRKASTSRRIRGPMGSRFM